MLAHSIASRSFLSVYAVILTDFFLSLYLTIPRVLPVGRCVQIKRVYTGVVIMETSSKCNIYLRRKLSPKFLFCIVTRWENKWKVMENDEKDSSVKFAHIQKNHHHKT